MIKYKKTSIADVWLIRSESVGDERGKFARLFCDVTHEEITGQKFSPVQINQSFTAQKHTVRGLHFQKYPALEAKIVRCTKGRVFDVAVDLRRNSPSFLQHFAVELSEAEGNALFIPEGFAHGFQSLTDDVEMIYLHSSPYSNADEGGLKYDDPSLNINWRHKVAVISDRDKNFEYIGKDFKGIDYEM